MGDGWTDRGRLVRMLAMAIDECLSDFEAAGRPLPLLLCAAEPGRSSHADGDAGLIAELERELPFRWDPKLSAVLRHGRSGLVAALARARALIYDGDAPVVVVAAVDSLLDVGTLRSLESRGRLLTERNSDGFVPGEAAGAVLVTRARQEGTSLVCLGIGLAQENVSADGSSPFRGDGLTTAIKRALADAGCSLEQIDWRITDNSGEQYFFKESALALSRTLRGRKETFDIWHPAECVGEVGAAIGPILLGVLLSAARKGYAPGPLVLLHAGSDAGERSAAVLQIQG